MQIPHTHLSEGLSSLMVVSRSDRTSNFPESAVFNSPEEYDSGKRSIRPSYNELSTDPQSVLS